MAAATGYDGPNDEQLHAYAELDYIDLPIYGEKLAEVFAVRVPGAATSSRGNRPPPCGMIHVFGRNCSQSLIFNRSHCDDPTSSHPCDSQGNLVLTGPERTISSDGRISFHIYLHDNSREFSSEESWENGVDLDQDIGIYDRPISVTVNTPYGPAEVIYAIMSQGVECKVSVTLARQDGEDPISLFGRIVARSELFDIGCVLFYNEHVKGICVGSGDLIPLARNLLVVPLYKQLVIELDLHSYYGDEIMRETLEFHPFTEGKQMARLISKSGAEIEVTISLTQYFFF